MTAAVRRVTRAGQRWAIIGPMETALYYTLSTIAQTLAGALAILVAVVLFKLSSLSKEQEIAADTLRRFRVDPDVYLRIAREQGFDAMAERALGKGGDDIRSNQEARRACDAATAAYKTWGDINLRLFAALAATVVAIGVCFIALPFTPQIATFSVGSVSTRPHRRPGHHLLGALRLADRGDGAAACQLEC